MQKGFLGIAQWCNAVLMSIVALAFRILQAESLKT